MKLVVGLGNPGRKYDQTRHNIGFMVADALVRRYVGSPPTTKFEGEISECRIENEKVLVLCPHTYMNASGQSVRKAIEFYKLSLEDILVICDDLNLDTGRVRLRRSGSAGGQKGLVDIIRHLGSDQWARLKIGIGRPPAKWQVSDYVLGKFDKTEQQEMEHAIVRSCDATASWVADGVTEAMNRFNAAKGA
ncbi:aminoacyl-tRNA hydrolase [Rhodopirellula halodulae]|uniref:aminoacyl-tRNA hydrolase n=1 Tax=Rhodopirellula halodulae TaxID=2894198 RepID=UPI001E3CAF1F|nr:aminoacyl-tRNA hydrolase [Rhodopirellula sp. JC737]MCC9654723.1 aminoacyl-tRNA hydrolase [Rhodopirellula sp. JC737]